MRRFLRFLRLLWHRSQDATNCPTCNDHHWLVWTVVDRTGRDLAEIASCPDCNPRGERKPCYKGVGRGRAFSVTGLHHVKNVNRGGKRPTS